MILHLTHSYWPSQFPKASQALRRGLVSLAKQSGGEVLFSRTRQNRIELDVEFEDEMRGWDFQDEVQRRFTDVKVERIE